MGYVYPTERCGRRTRRRRRRGAAMRQLCEERNASISDASRSRSASAWSRWSLISLSSSCGPISPAGGSTVCGSCPGSVAPSSSAMDGATRFFESEPFLRLDDGSTKDEASADVRSAASFGTKLIVEIRGQVVAGQECLEDLDVLASFACLIIGSSGDRTWMLDEGPEGLVHVGIG